MTSINDFTDELIALTNAICLRPNGTVSKKIEITKPDVEIINIEQFDKIDQIISFQDFLFVVDWGCSPGVHVLNGNMNYVTKIEIDNKFICWISMITDHSNNHYMAALLKERIVLLDISITNSYLTYSIKSSIDCFSSPGKIYRPYGLVQNPKNKEIYFIDTNSNNLVVYSFDVNNKLAYKRIQKLKMPQNYRLPRFRDAKVLNDKLYLTDYIVVDLRKTNERVQAVNGFTRVVNEFIHSGNGCVHVYSLTDNNAVVYEKNFGRGILFRPYSIEFNKTHKNHYVCDRVENGIVFVFNSEFKLIQKILLDTIKYPYYIHFYNQYCYMTHIYGTEFKYIGDKQLYKFKLDFIQKSTHSE